MSSQKSCSEPINNPATAHLDNSTSSHQPGKILKTHARLWTRVQIYARLHIFAHANMCKIHANTCKYMQKFGTFAYANTCKSMQICATACHGIRAVDIISTPGSHANL